MSESPSDVHASLEPSFSASPNLRSHKPLPRRTDRDRKLPPVPASLPAPGAWQDDENESEASSQLPEQTAPSPAPTGTESGLPPTPPSNSHDGLPAADFSPPPHADGVVASLTSRKSTLSTPVNSQRSPPTPDPSPPRRMAASMTTPQRPAPFTYPSSRTESFMTAREEPFSSETESRSSTPLASPLSVVEEDRGLGPAFERQEDDATPRNTVIKLPSEEKTKRNERGSSSKDDVDPDDIPNREWDTNLMRNVTVRRKRNPSPQKKPISPRPTSPATTPTTASTPRRSSSLRERVEASRHSPQTPSIENFARAIGWPAEPEESLHGQAGEADQKRLSESSASDMSVVQAVVVVTPPQRRQILRHSGRNLAYRRNTDSPTNSSSTAYSRASTRTDDAPLHRLVHKRASIGSRDKRISSDSAATVGDRSATPASLLQRTQDSTAATMAHQQSVRSVLQPAADIMSRSNSVTRNLPAKNYHKRIASVPEAAMRKRTPSISETASEVSAPESPSPRRERKPSSRLAYVEAASPTSPNDDRNLQHHKVRPGKPSPSRTGELKTTPNVNKSLPEIPLELPIQSTNELDNGAIDVLSFDREENRSPSAMHDRVRHLLAVDEAAGPSNVNPSPPQEPSQVRGPTAETVPIVRRGSTSTRGRSTERRHSSQSQDRTSISRDALLRPSLDRVHTDERSSHEWHSFHTDENGRVSFDRSTSRTDEHAMARHLFAQTTPFSQFSDTPIEVSEATAVSIYPHNNHSLLVVQQVARASLQPPEVNCITNEAHSTTPVVEELEESNTSFLNTTETPRASKPTLTFEPSTPPMQIDLPAFEAVDSPLKNPRKPPEPPVIKFIPPTPAEELERQLVPGPPKRSDSHPQRRLSLKQRARRYSDNLISPFLARASGMRGRSSSVSHAGHGQVQVPTVSDEDGSLHPFWRPRGFWDGFDDSDSDSDDGILPRGGDTSDVEDDDPEPSSPRKLGTLGRRLTNGFKGHSNFLIGNSLGVERSGTNRRKPRIDLPSRRSIGKSTTTKRDAPKILIQPPTLPFRTRSPRVEKQQSRSSIRSSASAPYDRPRRRRATWRQGKKIPGLKGVQVQYIGLSGMKERLRERRAERRREALRKSIGGRWYVEPAAAGGGVA